MKSRYPFHIVRMFVIVVAVLFGAVTLFAGGQVLMGSDPGYQVFRPLLIFNTAMGLAYMAAGAAVWRNANTGRNAAAAVFFLNLVVLAGIFVIDRSGEVVAAESRNAMTLRTGVWLILLLGTAWLVRQQRAMRL